MNRRRWTPGGPDDPWRSAPLKTTRELAEDDLARIIQESPDPPPPDPNRVTFDINGEPMSPAAKALGRRASWAPPPGWKPPPRKERAMPDPNPPLTLEAIRALSPAERRKLGQERWGDVAAALAGKRPPGRPLSAAELADLEGTLRKHPELAGDEDRWSEIQAEMKRRQEESR